MNKQPRMIDADKILWELALQGFMTDDIKRKIEDGEFDPDPIPLPTIKSGDKVKHVKRGIGTVLKVHEDKVIASFSGVTRGCKPDELEVIPNE